MFSLIGRRASRTSHEIGRFCSSRMFACSNPPRASSEDGFPCELEVITWPPAIQVRDKHARTIKCTPLSSVDAKDELAQARSGRRVLKEKNRIEIYGHAAMYIDIHLNHRAMDSAVIKHICGWASRQGIPIDDLEKVTSYVSWYPLNSQPTGATYDLLGALESKLSEDEKSFLYSSDFPDELRNASVDFLSTEYLAKNVSPRVDAYGYGRPLSGRSIHLDEGINVIELFDCLVTMMRPDLSSDATELVFNRVVPNASYYGLDIMRLFVELLRPDLSSAYMPALIHPHHVCTTAVLRLLMASVGLDETRLVAKKVVSHYPDLTTSGLPLADFTHHFSIELAKRMKRQQSIRPGRSS